MNKSLYLVSAESGQNGNIKPANGR